MIIDAHHHLWQYSSTNYSWIDSSMSFLQQDFLLKELNQVCQKNNVDGTVVVQARESIEETRWLLSLANKSELIKGVVGWIDLKSDDLTEQLAAFSVEKKLVGFRHVIQGEADELSLKSGSFLMGLKLLAKYNYRYDLLIFPNQLQSAIAMLEKVPELNVVLDHIAKPNMKTHEGFQQWQSDIELLAKNPKVYCKLSGLVTEADWTNWQGKDFQPYLDTVLACFGEKRVMYGSDWPVCLLAGEYEDVLSIVDDFVKNGKPCLKKQVFSESAVCFYGLK